MNQRQRRPIRRSPLAWTVWAAALLLLAGCGDGSVGDSDPVADGWTEPSTPEPQDTEGTGFPVDDPDPYPADDPCQDDDDCPDPDGDTWTPEYGEGDVLLVLAYTKLRKQPNNQAAAVAVHTNGGAHGGHPSGMVPPGQEVVVLADPPTNKYYRVEYRDRAGWIHKKKVELFDSSVHPVRFARRAAVRNAFFMHQLRRARWNKDGLASNSNCAPTSLAMAAKIFGHGTAGKTVEQSIHEARLKYDPAPLCESGNDCGTNRYEIRTAAQKLGFRVKTLEQVGDTEDRMQRIDQALANKKVVQLEGWAGKAYRDRMTEAYRNSADSWVQNRVYTYGDEPEEYHSILVVSRLDSGKYLVADPLSEVGMVTMNRATLKAYFKRWGGSGNVVW
ncbi:MAG: hypothetical protein JRI23_23775 [Deltaproteobacteria bacterium]|jgi:hypothetical protein|nr:hypothetical protein [Deltaproteobacteria bacterium]MBW2535011.1 hypothetical protein [Deltaproteobacteria bacterium]